MDSHSPKSSELRSPPQQGHWEVLRRIALLSADLGIPPSQDWVIECVAEHGYPYDEINAEHWLHDIHGVIQLLQPTARRKRSRLRGDTLLATATAHTFQHCDLVRTLERWHLEGVDDHPTLLHEKESQPGQQ